MSKQLCEDFALLALLSGYFNVSETVGRDFGYAGTDLGVDPVYCNERGEISRAGVGREGFLDGGANRAAVSVGCQQQNDDWATRSGISACMQQ